MKLNILIYLYIKYIYREIFPHIFVYITNRDELFWFFILSVWLKSFISFYKVKEISCCHVVILWLFCSLGYIFKLVSIFYLFCNIRFADIACYIFSRGTKHLEAENVHLCKFLPGLRCLSSVFLIKMKTMAKIILRALWSIL